MAKKEELKTYEVKVTTTFVAYEEVEAKSPEAARSIVERAVEDGEDYTDTDDFETIVEVVDPKDGWQVAIDLTGEDQESNIAILSSPVFPTEGEALEWYEGLDFSLCEVRTIDKGLDIIMMHLVDGKPVDTYLLN